MNLRDSFPFKCNRVYTIFNGYPRISITLDNSRITKPTPAYIVKLPGKVCSIDLRGLHSIKINV